MRDKLIERVRHLVAYKPKGVDFDDFIADPDPHLDYSERFDDAMFGWGYLYALADNNGITCLEVLDHFDVAEGDLQ